MMLVALTGKQSGRCCICGKKITQKNIGIIFKRDDVICLCCNNFLCFLEINMIKDKEQKG